MLPNKFLDAKIEFSRALILDPNNTYIVYRRLSGEGKETLMMKKNWFVVHTKPGQEETVALHLKHKEIETYVPKLETYTYNGLKKIKKIKSLFPNYLFAWCERKNVPQVCWTRGVKKVLWENNAPQPIADELILSLKSLTGNDGLIHPVRWRTYQKHDLVLITSGPFKDLYALFDHWESDKERVCLLLNLLNAQIRVTVPAALLAVA